jgi:hypothetical protein
MTPELTTAITALLTAIATLVYAFLKARQGDKDHTDNAARIDKHDVATGINTKA